MAGTLEVPAIGEFNKTADPRIVAAVKRLNELLNGENVLGEGGIADGAISSKKLKPTAGVITASGESTLTASYADVSGAKLEITPSVASLLLVTAVFDFEVETVATPGAVVEAVGSLKVDSESEQSIGAIFSKKSLGTVDALRNSASQTYALSLTAATHTIKMRAKKNGEGTAKARTFATRLSYLLLAA